MREAVGSEWLGHIRACGPVAIYKMPSLDYGLFELLKEAYKWGRARH